MGFKGKESLAAQKFLDDLDRVLPVQNRVFNPMKAIKGTSLTQPELSMCSVNLLDQHFSSVMLSFYPEDWKWGEPSEIMKGSLFLRAATIRNPLMNLTKQGKGYGSNIGVHILGDVEIKESTGLMKSRIVGHQFRAIVKESRWLAEKMNADLALLDSMRKEFKTGKGRSLPSISTGGTIAPFGGFDIFDVDGQKEKVAETDFWKINDPTTQGKLVNRLNVLRNLAKHLQQPGTALTVTEPARKRTVLWDMTHHETLRSSFEKAVNTLQTELKIAWGPILGEWSEKCLADKTLIGWPAILFLGGIESEGKLAKTEIQNIVNFVESGGALLITAPCSLYSLKDANKLASNFGFRFTGNKAEDAANHEGKHKDHIIIRNFERHPITEGLSEICFGDYGGTTIESKLDTIEPLAFTSKKASPAGTPVLVYVSRGKGIVVAFGCSSTFDDKNVEKLDNMKFLKNVFEFLGKKEPTSEAFSSSSWLPPPPPPLPPPPPPPMSQNHNVGVKTTKRT